MGDNQRIERQRQRPKCVDGPAQQRLDRRGRHEDTEAIRITSLKDLPEVLGLDPKP